MAKRNLCHELLKFIDSIPKEAVSEDLKKAARHIATETLNDVRFATTTIGYDIGKLQDIFITGAQFQKEQLINKSCEWLKKNRKNYSTNTLGTEYLINDFRKAMEK